MRVDCPSPATQARPLLVDFLVAWMAVIRTLAEFWEPAPSPVLYILNALPVKYVQVSIDDEIISLVNGYEIQNSIKQF